MPIKKKTGRPYDMDTHIEVAIIAAIIGTSLRERRPILPAMDYDDTPRESPSLSPSSLVRTKLK